MIPEFQKHIYRVNEATGYFEKTLAPVGFTKLPGELKLEPPQREDYKGRGVRFILKSRMIKGKHPFQTGLIPTTFGRWFFGDCYHPNEKVKNSFCLFRFNQTSSELTIYYFNHFKLYPKQRELFIHEFVRRARV